MVDPQEFLLRLGLKPHAKVLDLKRNPSGAGDAEQGDEPSFRSGSGVRTADLRLS
jgi:hypothetical protein